MARICANCGHPIGETDAFCLQCGVRVANPSVASEQSMGGMTSFCPECGKRVKPHWSFCMNCGQSLSRKKEVLTPAENHRQPSKTVVMSALEESPDNALQPRQALEPDANQPKVFTRTVYMEDFGAPASAPIFGEDDYELWDKTDAGLPPDDAPTAVQMDDDADEAPTMVYVERRMPVCVLTRVSSGDVLKLTMPTTIGRGNAAQVRVNGNPYIGRVHARVFEREGSVFVCDAGSANHTYVNGTMLLPNEEAKIRTGDTLSLAKEEFLVEIQ